MECFHNRVSSKNSFFFYHTCLFTFSLLAQKIIFLGVKRYFFLLFIKLTFLFFINAILSLKNEQLEKSFSFRTLQNQFYSRKQKKIERNIKYGESKQ